MSITSFIRSSILKDNFLCSKCNLLIQVWLYISPDLGIVCIHEWLNFILFIFLSGVGTFFSTWIVQWYIFLSTHLCILSSTWTVQCHIIILLSSRVPCVTDGWCYVILLYFFRVGYRVLQTDGTMSYYYHRYYVIAWKVACI